MILTNWGYKLIDSNSLVGLLSVDEFNTFTADKFSGDERIQPSLSSASNAVRNYCGWHVAPSLNCEIARPLHDYSFIKVRGCDMIVQLPARYVSAVSAVIIGADWDEGTQSWSGTSCRYSFDVNGLLTIYDAFPGQYDRSSLLVIRYTAGLPDSLTDALKELIASQITHGLSNTYGINSETSGGVSVTYSQNWMSSARANVLTDTTKEILQPYKVGGVF